MRWIFYALLAANVGYFAWQYAAGAGANSQNSDVASKKLSTKGEAIKLLSEARERATPVAPVLRSELSQSPVGQAAPAEVIDSDEENLCGVFGPFVDAREADRYLSYLQGQKLSPRMVQESNELSSNYWAYLPPLKADYQALKMMGQLKERGVQSFLINEGDLKGGLSFGVHADMGSVENIRQVAVRLGLEVEVLEKTRSYEFYLVEVSLENEEVSVLKAVSRAQVQYPQVKYRQKDCKSVASEQ